MERGSALLDGGKGENPRLNVYQNTQNATSRVEKQFGQTPKFL